MGKRKAYEGVAPSSTDKRRYPGGSAARRVRKEGKNPETSGLCD